MLSEDEENAITLLIPSFAVTAQHFDFNPLCSNAFNRELRPVWIRV